MARLQNSVLVEDVEYPQLSIGGKHLPSAGSYKPMTRSNYEFLADMVAPLMGWPSAIEAMAFKRDKFIKRAVKAWEDVNPVEELDDYNPY